MIGHGARCNGGRIPLGRPLVDFGPFCLLAVCGLLLLAVGLAFGQTAGFDFVNLDDPGGDVSTGW